MHIDDIRLTWESNPLLSPYGPDALTIGLSELVFNDGNMIFKIHSKTCLCHPNYIVLNYFKFH